MSIAVSDIKIPIEEPEGLLKSAAASKLGINPSEIERLVVKRRSLDSRKKDIHYVYTAEVTLTDKNKQKNLEERFGKAREIEPEEIIFGSRRTERAVVVGAGPCGLFAALELARHGYRPLLVERGKNMNERTKDVSLLTKQGVLSKESNVCFGAGGAGAFSDGKLTTRIKDPRSEIVIKTFAEFGAPKEITYLAMPHTGTEYIRKAVIGMIEEIERLGGNVEFGSKFTALRTSKSGVSGIEYEKNGIKTIVETGSVILAIGHSARDTYKRLFESGISMQAKPFAVGLRVEHLREFIDIAQYGDNHVRLGAAEYRLTSKHTGRGVYTFCMCPGGEVINASTEVGGVCVNGMSYYARDGANSNSAVVVSVNPSDFGGDALGGIEFQRSLEQKAFAAAGGSGAPVQTLADFAAGRITKSFGEIKPSFKPSPVPADLNECLPGFISDGIKHALADFGRKLKGFDSGSAVLTGVETRTSAPLRILRNELLQSVDICGLYPAGEGAGYAGGIVSAAVDGIKCAAALMREFAKPV